MRLRNIYLNILTVAAISMATSCNDFLEEEVFSQLAPGNYLTNKEGIESVLTDAYAKTANMRTNNSIYVIAPQEWPTDMLYQSGDNVERTARNFINFNWDPAIDFLTGNWDPPYQAIRNCNMLLEAIDEAALTDAEKAAYKAECRFLRAVNYIKLYDMFGPVPLRVSTSDELQLPRASDEEMRAFIETELQAVVPVLPNPGEEPAYGRAHKAAALGFLCKYYLNARQWENAASTANQIITDFNYGLFDSYEDLFRVENERNEEFIWVRPALASTDRATANSWSNTAFPANFAEAPELGVSYLQTYVNWPNEFRIYDAFYNSFDPNDRRRKLFVTSYINSDGETVSLLDEDNIRSFKYIPDPNATGASHGNDIPEIRYADILLSRAEALNELSGPNQESIDLINQVRERANVDPLELADFPSKESLRDHIVDERGWEFYSEGHRRMDLIRTDRFISGALARGKTNAQEHHKLYPIPLAVMESNPALAGHQNEGY